MDQVLLQWDGGHSVLLARVRDAEGCTWLCSKDVYRKLGSSISYKSWAHVINCGEQQPSCAVLMHVGMHLF